MGRVRLVGARTTWTTVEDGDFFCPDCGGDRNYERRTGRRRLAVLGLPLFPRGVAGPVVVCSSCRGRFGVEVLSRPTTTRLASLLRDAVHTIALGVLAAGGGARSRTARLAAVGSMRSAGFTGCDEEQLLTMLAALNADRARGEAHLGTGAAEAPAGAEPGEEQDTPAGLCPVGEAELRQVLAPLADHLVPAGRESLLLQGARIALADGPYESAELTLLQSLGRALRMPAEDVERLLAAALERR